MKTKLRIKVGDTVVIKSPNVFQRCGYPMSLLDAQTVVFKEHGDDITKFLRELRDERAKWSMLHNDTTFHAIVKALGRERLRVFGHGGRDRTVHTELRPDLVDIRGRVQEVKIVRTGTYNYGGGEGDDYIPPTLENAQAHRILTLDLLVMPYNHIRIEDIHCEIEKSYERNQI